MTSAISLPALSQYFSLCHVQVTFYLILVISNVRSEIYTEILTDRFTSKYTIVSVQNSLHYNFHFPQKSTCIIAGPANQNPTNQCLIQPECHRAPLRSWNSLKGSDFSPTYVFYITRDIRIWLCLICQVKHKLFSAECTQMPHSSASLMSGRCST